MSESPTPQRRDVRWRLISWGETVLSLFPALVAMVFARNGREYLLLAGLGVLYAIFQGARHWITARRGFRRVGLTFDAHGIRSPELSAARVPWKAITAIEAPTGLSRAAVVRVNDRSLIADLRNPLLKRFAPQPGKAILLSGWKLNADMATVAAEMDQLRLAAANNN